MEAFSLLKFWKSSSVSVSGGLVAPLPAGTNTVSDETEESSAAGDDGPFFDLQFSGNDSDDENSVAELVCVDEAGEVEVVEESVERSDPNLPVSTSEDLFNLLAVESGSDPNSGKPQVFPVSLLRSATKLRILMAGFKKSSKAQTDPKQRKKLFTIKFKSGEVPIVSLFNRDKDHNSRQLNGVVSSFSSSSSTSSSSSSSSSVSTKPTTGESEQEPQAPAPDSDENKRNSKDGVQKYFKMVKPLYIRVSKRYGEKLGFSDEKSPVEEEEVGKESEKKIQGSLGVGLKVMMRKKLAGKNKSPETNVVAPAVSPSTGRQRDDSLIQQQEWIQGAILHCKRSFNASREDEDPDSVLVQSASDPTHEKKVNDCTRHEQNDVVGGR